MGKSDRSLRAASSAFAPHAPLLFPDPFVSLDMLSGAAFLYFSWPIMITTPPVIVTPESLGMMRLVEERQPVWASTITSVLRLHAGTLAAFEAVQKDLEPLQGAMFLVWPVYPAGTADLEASGGLLDAYSPSCGTRPALAPVDCASSELARHIFLEQYLALGKDLQLLYEYCGNLLEASTFDRTLACAYLLRLQAMRANPELKVVLLTNPSLLPLLDEMPVEPLSAVEPTRLQDVVAWEFFRQLLSPYLDPLDSRRAELVADIAGNRQDEIARLRARCGALAADVPERGGTNTTIMDVASHIRRRVEPELQALLRLDRDAFGDYAANLFSDERVWLSIVSFAAAMTAGQSAAAQGAALAALGVAGAKAVAALRDKGRTLRQSHYALVYRVATCTRRGPPDTGRSRGGWVNS